MMALFLDEVSRALAVFAHADDAEFMFGGTIARLTAKGADVNYVVCTDGPTGAPTWPRQVRNSRRPERPNSAPRPMSSASARSRPWATPTTNSS